MSPSVTLTYLFAVLGRAKMGFGLRPAIFQTVYPDGLLHGQHDWRFVCGSICRLVRAKDGLHDDVDLVDAIRSGRLLRHRPLLVDGHQVLLWRDFPVVQHRHRRLSCRADVRKMEVESEPLFRRNSLANGSHFPGFTRLSHPQHVPLGVVHWFVSLALHEPLDLNARVAQVAVVQGQRRRSQESLEKDLQIQQTTFEQR